MTISKTQLIGWLESVAAVMEENKDYLSDLDAAIGDADHGANVARGFSEVKSKLPEMADKDIATLMKTVAMTLMSKVGGASGLIYGNFFMRASTVCAGKEELNGDEFAELLETGVNGIIQRGRAELGDKTMLDAWIPAVDALKTTLDNGQSLADALTACADAAQKGMESTIPHQARKGRASYLGERSIGEQDPGATSTYLMLRALSEAV